MKRFASLILAFCMILTFAFANEIPIVTEDNAITGTVVREDTYEPVTDATVSLYVAGDRDTVIGSTETNPDNGTFILYLDDSLDESLNYELVISSILYLSRTIDLSGLTRTGMAIGYPIALSDVGTIMGTVTDANSGEPLSGVAVSIYDGDTLKAEGKTDNNGQYRIDTEKGVYQITFTLGGYDTVRLTDKLLGALASRTDVQMETNFSDDDYNHGTCGDGVYWALDENGTLKITGNGAMKNWEYRVNWDWNYNYRPWKCVCQAESAAKGLQKVQH